MGNLVNALMDSYHNYSVDHFINSNCTNSYTTAALDTHTLSLNSQQYDTCKSNNLVILHQNIRGLTYKIDELLLSLSRINPQFFVYLNIICILMKSIIFI